MAITEIWQSEEYNESLYERTFTRKFIMDWADWNEASFQIYIGDEWSVDGSLKVIERSLRPLEGGNQVYVEVYYSNNDARTAAQEVPGYYSSWNDSFDFSMVEEPVEYYYDQISGSRKTWDSEWRSVHSSAADDTNPPALYVPRPRHFYRVSAYGSTFYMQRVLEAVGKVNSTNFASQILSTLRSDITDDLISWNDVEKWRLEGCPVERIGTSPAGESSTGKAVWRYDFMFNYNQDGWNNFDGVTTNMHNKMDFYTLLAGMDSDPPSGSNPDLGT